MCTFDDAQANKIHSLLRRPIRAKGIATIQPYETRIDSLHIRDVELLPSLDLGGGNFFANSTIKELAATQRVKPIKNVSVLAGALSKDEDIDEFLSEIYKGRE